MGHFDTQQEAPAPYAPTMNVPPPVSVEYPGKDGAEEDFKQDQTTSMSGGFWKGIKGCCTTVCCCCFLDCCYVESQNICGLVLKFCCSGPIY